MDYIWLWVLIGMIMGIVLSALYRSVILPKCDGTIVIDDSDEEKTKWQLIYDGDPNDISNKKSIRFRVHIEK